MDRTSSALAALLFASAAGCGGDASNAQLASRSSSARAAGPTTTAQQSGTTNRLQAISPVSEDVAWASGLGGTFTVTTDGGRTWRAGTVAGAEALQFRDVQGVSASVAYLLSAGVGSDSRIYKTTDGGSTWKLQFQATDPNAFYDCFAFWSPSRGLTMGDGINGRFPVLRTSDGQGWTDIGNHLPPAQDGEGAFAASGTCVATQGDHRAWIVTTNSRVFSTRDSGNSWTATTAPIVGGTGTAGVFSVAFRDAVHGMVGGGDFLGTTVVANAARSADGGKTWTLTAPAPITGAIFGLSYARGPTENEDENSSATGRTVVATGPGGSAWTLDEGNTWHAVAGASGYWAVAFGSQRVGWLVGTGGRILRIDF